MWKGFDDEMSLQSEIKTAISQEIGNLDVNVPDISQLASELRMELVSQINGSDMPGGVKNALTNSISVSVISPEHAVISISVMRPSIYMERVKIGRYGMADLALVYDHRKRIKQSAVYYDSAGNFIPIGRIEGFARAYSTDYLQKTASSFMSKNPDCTVTVSK